MARAVAGKRAGRGMTRHDRDLPRDQTLAFAARVDARDDATAGQHRHGEVAVLAQRFRHVRLEPVIEAEDARGAVAVPDE